MLAFCTLRSHYFLSPYLSFRFRQKKPIMYQPSVLHANAVTVLQSRTCLVSSAQRTVHSTSLLSYCDASSTFAVQLSVVVRRFGKCWRDFERAVIPLSLLFRLTRNRVSWFLIYSSLSMDCERENFAEFSNENNDACQQTDIPVVSLHQSLLRQHHLSFNQLKDQPTTSHHHHHQHQQPEYDKAVQKEIDNQMLVNDLTTQRSSQNPKVNKYHHHESCSCQLCSSSSLAQQIVRPKPSTWTCSICPLGYKRPADLNRHMKRKHGMSLMKNDKNVLVPIAISHHHKFVHHDLQPLNLSLKCVYSEASVESAESMESEITVDFDQPLDLSGNKNSPIDYRQKTLNKCTDHTIESRICAAPPNNKSNVSERNFDAFKLGIPHITTNIFHSGRPSISAPSIRYRPYKCSECGRRSNWRWDLNKHIRTSNHPQAYLIELSEYVARATFHEVLKKDNYCDATLQTTVQNLQCDPNQATMESSDLVIPPQKQYTCNSCGYRSNWKCDMSKHLKLHNSSDSNLMTEVMAKETPVSYEKCQNTNESPSWITEPDLNKNIQTFPNSSPENKDYLIVKCNSSDGIFPFSSSHTVDARKTKKFKCSACPYRSNFRSDVGRHIRHKHDRATCRIVVMSEAEAASTLGEYMDTWARKKFVPSPNKRRCLMSLPCLHPSEAYSNRTQMTEPPFAVSSTNSEYSKLSTGAASQDPEIQAKTLKSKRWWKCSSCDYRDQSKDIIVQHWHYKHNSATLGTDEELMGDVTGISADSESSFQDEKMICQNKNENSIQPDLKNHPEKLICHSPSKNKMESGESPPRINRLNCDVCPYTTSTFELLNFHKSHHEAKEGNTISCKFCPYFVSTSSLLNQHLLLHTEEIRNLLQTPQLCEPGQNIGGATKSVEDQHLPMNLSSALFPCESEKPHDKVSVFLMTNAVRSGGRTTYLCSQCPYVSCNRNDYLYHRQFHRPRPTAFKCLHCPYWVSQKRLLSQHYKVHELDYQQKHRGHEFASTDIIIKQSVNYGADNNNNNTNIEMSRQMVESIEMEQLESICSMEDTPTSETEDSDKIIEDQKGKLLEPTMDGDTNPETNDEICCTDDITEEIETNFTEEKGVFLEKLGLTSYVTDKVL